MKRILEAVVAVLVTLSTHSGQNLLSRYSRVESYEIRPGVLMTPRYAPNGDLCEMVIEKRHVRGNTVDFSSSIEHASVLQMIDELAPPKERGSHIGGPFDYDSTEGNMAIQNIKYEHVAIAIYKTDALPDPGDIAVLIDWNRPNCRKMAAR